MKRKRQRWSMISTFFIFLLLVLVSGPGQLFAEEQQPGIATFTDGDADHYYGKGDSISFRMGPFPCQAGKTDYFVFGIMEKGSDNYDVSAPPLKGLSSGSAGYYLPVTADSRGYFSVSGQINQAADTLLKTGVLAVKIYTQEWSLLVNEKTGAEAFIPVVATDGTPAIVIGIINSGQPADPVLANSLVKVADNDDIDQVFFHGQPIVINYTLAADALPPSLPVEQLSITSGVFEDESTFNTATAPLTNPVITKTDSGLKIEATINNPDNRTLPSGVLGIKLNLPLSLPGAAALQQPMPVISNMGKAVIVGVKIPSGMFVDSNPPLADIKNLYNTETTITFTKGSQGSITFVPGLNIIDNRKELASLENCVNVNFDLQTGIFTFEVKTSALSFLKGKSAGIKAYGVMQKLDVKNLTNENITQLINMSVIDENGQAVPADQAGNYIDQANMSYDASTDILMIPVRHFTKYEISKQTSAAVSVTGVTLDQETLTLSAGGATATLNASIAPANATNQGVTWLSSDPSIATVVNGLVTPVAAGTSTITVTTQDGNKTATCVVTVVAKISSVTLTGSSGDLPVGANATFTGAASGATSQTKYVFWVRDEKGVWRTCSDLTTNNTCTLPNLQGGTYVVMAYATNGVDPPVASNKQYLKVGSSGVLNVIYQNGQIIATAVPSNVNFPLYDWWVQYPNGTWASVKGHFVTDDTCVIPVTVQGAYRVVANITDLDFYNVLGTSAWNEHTYVHVEQAVGTSSGL